MALKCGYAPSSAQECLTVDERASTVPILVTVVLSTFIPVLAATLAGVVATIWPPRARVTSAVQHFAADVVFAAAAIELLPELLRHSPVATILVSA